MRRLLFLLAALIAAPVPAQTPPAITPAPASTSIVAAPALQSRIAELPAMLADTGDYPAYFAPSFVEKVPRERWTALMAQIATGAGKPLKVEAIEATSPHAATVRVRFERGVVGVRLGIEPTPPHRVTTLLVTGMVAGEATVAETLAAIRALPGVTGFAVARLGQGAPVPLHRHNAEQPMAIGSEFKLVILAELVRAITAGERRWDDTVTLDGRPLPGGGYTQKPAGTAVPLRELARAMIAVSDNSATDILLTTLGRERVEAMLPVVGIAQPARMRPFLGTLEAFKLKALIAAGRIDWAGADEAARRRLLAGQVAAMPITDIPGMLFLTGQPLSIDTVEWHASADDLVRIMDWLRRNTEAGPAAEARAILSANPGVGAGVAAQWRWLGYKGGSEPGVMAMTYLAQGRDGQWYAASASWNDPTRRVDDTRFAALMARLLELAAPPPN